MGERGHPCKHLLVENTLENLWESEAPAVLGTPRFGWSLTLPVQFIRPTAPCTRIVPSRRRLA